MIKLMENRQTAKDICRETGTFEAKVGEHETTARVIEQGRTINLG